MRHTTIRKSIKNAKYTLYGAVHLHSDVQTAPFPSVKQVQPSSITHQNEQPSQSFVFPSSHSSLSVSTPSPHTSTHVEAVVRLPPEHSQPHAA